MVGLGREVGVISDRHQGILRDIHEQIAGYAPLHHRWYTQHLVTNLLRKNGTKDNFALFEEVACMLEVKLFKEKLEHLKTAITQKVDSGERVVEGTREIDKGSQRWWPEV